MIKRIIKRILSYFNLRISRINTNYDIDYPREFIEIYSQCKDYTATSIERMYALYEAVKYISQNKIEGEIVECGVWKAGSCMLIAKTLKRLGDIERKIILYDTFDGMTEPTDEDIEVETNQLARNILKKTPKNTDKYNIWAYAPLEMVKRNMRTTGYPEEKIIYVEGKVEQTLPKHAPENISILRLDTDWYESTRHELESLYPILSLNGILIIDDYGHFTGARKAVDEYFLKIKKPPYMSRIDLSGRLIIKSK
ncbi:MAG: TylF/MycF/NovP-related O-methyltransferase [Pseudomonadota bacterium]|nr:TylF/MycF/NovP-related O-methyltransferase [Pseudomonadota bacterium]